VLFGDVRYGWDQKQTGYVLAVVGVFSVLVNAIVVRRLIPRIGERRALLFGLSCGTLGFLVYAFAERAWMFLLGLPISALWALAQPATQALITRQVGPEVQGRIQGALMSLVAMAGIVAPALFATSFGWFVGPHAPVRFPGIAFLIAGVLLGSAVAIAWRFARAPAPVAAVAAEG
jgi:DHA1 family tetracycline resistance protein-like MFS transporter